MKCEKTAIIIHGGGIKATFSAGVAYGLSRIGITDADVLIGISSGLPTMAYFASQQYEFMKNIWTHEVGNKKFISYANFFSGKSIFNLRYLIDVVFRKKYPLQVSSILKSKSTFLIPLLNYQEGKIEFFNNHDIKTERDFWKLLQATITVHDSYIDWHGPFEKFVDADLDPFAFYRQQIIPKDWNVLVIINHKELHRTLRRWIGVRLFRLLQARHFPDGIKTKLRMRGELIDSGVKLFEEFKREYSPIIISPTPRTKLTIGSLITRDKNKLSYLFEEGERVVADAMNDEKMSQKLKTFIKRSDELSNKNI